jgi:hypothetical protein
MDKVGGRRACRKAARLDVRYAFDSDRLLHCREMSLWATNGQSAS